MVLFCVSILSLLLLATVNSLTEVFRWPGGKPPVAWPNLTWEAEYSRLAVTVIGIKVWADNIYLTAPRWHGNSHPLNVGVLPRPTVGSSLPLSSPIR